MPPKKIIDLNSKDLDAKKCGVLFASVLAFQILVGNLFALNVDFSSQYLFQKLPLSGFAGDFLLPDLSENSIRGYCDQVNANYSGSPCDKEHWGKFFGQSGGAVFAPSENNKAGQYNLLVSTGKEGDLVYMDSDPAHQEDYEGKKVAYFGRRIIDRQNSDFKGIVTDYAGNFWVVDRGHGRVLRFSHQWSGGLHQFNKEGEFKITGSLIDLYFNDMKTAVVGDDRLYLLTNYPSRIIVINPYFQSQQDESTINGLRNASTYLSDIKDPKAIFGAYNNQPEAIGQDPRLIYLIDDFNRIRCLKDLGRDLQEFRGGRLETQPGTEFVSGKSTVEGDLYMVDKGANRILKYNSTLNFLFSVGQQGTLLANQATTFNKPADIAVRGTELVVLEEYTSTSGMQRFLNVSKILETRFNGLDDKGVNFANFPAKKPLPTIDFKLSEASNLKLVILKRDFADLGKNTVVLKQKNLGTFASGWNTAEIDWDGMFGGAPVLDNVVVALVAQKYFPDGDHSVLREIVTDVKPPELIGPGQISYNAYPSGLLPFTMTVHFDEQVMGTMSIFNSSHQKIAQLEKPAFDGGRSMEFMWSITGLAPCEPFYVEVQAVDFAGNSGPVIKINGPGGILPNLVLENKTGGLGTPAFAISPNSISPVSTIPAFRFASVHTDVTSVCTTPFYYNIKVYDNPAMAGLAVFALGTDAGDHRLLESGSFTKDWHGENNAGTPVPDGTYYTEVTLESLAGYKATSKGATGFSNAINVKTVVPKVTLSGLSTNKTVTLSGVKSLFVSGNDKIDASVGFEGAAVSADGKVVVEYSLFASNGTVTAFRDEYPMGEIIGNKISLPKGDSRSRLGGKYLFSVYFQDEIGNSGKASKSTNTILQAGESIGSFVIDNTTPSLLVDIEGNILTKPVDLKANLFNNTSGFSDGTAFDYRYDLKLKIPSGSITTLKSNVAFPGNSLNTSETISKTLMSANGTYEVIAILRDKLGRESVPASGFFYLNERPNLVGVNLAGQPISGKSYVTGALGDPFIATNGLDNPFDKYVLLFKVGSNQDPGSNLNPEFLMANGWTKSTGSGPGNALFAPFFRQETEADFPYSNISRTPTNLQALATVGYIDAGGLTNGSYTLLALSFEKNNTIPRSSRANFAVDNTGSATPFKIKSLKVEPSAAGARVTYIVAKNANLHFVIAKFDTPSGKYLKRVQEFHFANVPGETTQEFDWNFEDAFGNKVDDGQYRILAQAEAITGTAADWAEAPPIQVNTTLEVTKVAVTPSTIVVPPRIGAAIATENTAEVSFISNKYCTARLEVFYQGSVVAVTPNRIFNTSGVSFPKVVSWDGSGSGNLPYNAGTPYELKLVVTSLDDLSDKVQIGNLLVTRISPAMADNKPKIPGASLSIVDPDLQYDAVPDKTTVGTSEVLWQTKMSGKMLSGAPGYASGSIGVSGRQAVSVWKSDYASNRMEMTVKKSLKAIYFDYEYDVLWPTSVPGGEKRTYHSTGVQLFVGGSDDVGTSFTAGSNSQFHAPPQITLKNISTGTLPNDMLHLVDIVLKSEIDPTNTKKASVSVQLSIRANVVSNVTKTLKNQPSDGTPDHYNPLALTEAFGDFDAAVYLTKPRIDYEYTFTKIPEAGGISLLDMGLPVQDYPGALANGMIISDAVIISGEADHNSSGFSLRRDNHNGSSNHIGTLTLPPALANAGRYDLRVRAFSNSEEIKDMFWPFPPANGVPPASVDGTNYAQIAYKTSNNVDPRTSGSNFSTIVGPQRILPGYSYAANGQVIQPYNIEIGPDRVYPFSINIVPDLYPGTGAIPGSTTGTLISSNQSWPPGVTLTVAGSSLTVNATPLSMPRIAWNSSIDPFLGGISPLGTIGFRETFSKNGLLLKSRPIDIPTRYRDLVQMTPGSGDLTNISTYRFNFWRDAIGIMTANAALSDLSYSGPTGGLATLTYVDGSPNTALTVDDFDLTSNTFSVKHAANGIPKRFIEVRGSLVGPGGSGFETISLDYYGLDSKTWNEAGNIAMMTASPIPDIPVAQVAKVLGYWDVTHCNGAYILKLTATKNGGTEEFFQTINVGTPVNGPSTNFQVVYSPYSKAQVLFPAGSSYKGLVSIVPIKPDQIRGVDLDKNKIIPLGPLLEISPSGLLFDKTALPKVTFSMTADDVAGMGVAADHLGELNIYYVDEKRGELVPLETAVSRFIMRQGASNAEPVAKNVNNPVLNANDVFYIEAPIEHTSVYGSFSDAADKLHIQSPAALVTSAILPSLTGTVTGATSVKVYVSPDGVLDKTEPVYTATVAAGAWSAGPLTLNEGKNYLFAVATIGGKETVSQTEITVDQIAPVLTGTFPSQYVAYNVAAPYSFDVFSNEKGSILVKEVGNANALTSEYALIPTGTGNFKATIQILPSAFKDLRTMVELHAVDEAGNSSAHQYIEVLVDNEAPTFILTNADIDRPIAGSLKDIQAVDRVDLLVSVQGVQIRKSVPFTGGKSGDFSFSLDLSTLPEGDGTLTLEGFDKAQNRTVFGPEPIHVRKSGSLKTNAIAQYLFRPESNSTVQDVSGAGIPLDLSMSGANVARIPGGGITFTADNHGSIVKSVKVSPKLFDRITQSNEIGVEFWFKPGNLTQVDHRRVVEYGTETGTNNWNFAAGQSGKNLFFKLRTQSAQWIELVTTNNPLTQAGALRHVMVTYAPYNAATGEGGMRIYLDKVQVAVNQEQGLLAATGNCPWGKNYALCLGNRPAATSGGWQGDLLMLSVYDRYFDASQVQARYEAGIPSGAATQRVLLGKASAGRVLPVRTVEGYRVWKEDAKFDGGDLAMEGVKYPYGLSGSPSASGGLTWMAYDLRDAESRFAPGRSALRLAGFSGRQDNAGSINTYVKTSSSQTAPSDEDWKNETGSVIVRSKAANLQNAPMDIDLEGARWLMLGMDSESPDNADLGTFGSPELILGDRFSATRNGLRYAYYEGAWDYLPNFAKLAAVKKGDVDKISLSPRRTSDNFGFRFEGYIAIATQGLYNFYLTSDDGSRLYIDERTVVDNDGTHALVEQAGSVFLSPGYHRFAVDYFEKGGSEGLAVRYSAANLPKQIIPTDVLFKDSPATPALEGGLTYQYYEGNWSQVPDFGGMVPVKSGVATNFDLEKRNREDNFGFQFTGYLNILDAGTFTFHLNSDDGSKLYIDEVLVVSNDGNHGPRDRTGSAALTKGIHRIRVDYYESSGGQVLTVSYEGPGVSLRIIPNEVLSHAAEVPKYEKLIALNTTASGANVPNSLQGFPVLVRLDASNFDFSSARSDGSDIRFRAADGSSLPFEIETWEPSYKQAAVWVKANVPGNAVSNIRMQWGNPLALGGSSSKDVFGTDNGFVGDWHLGEPGNSTSGGYRDATGKAQNATGVNTGSGTDVIGAIGFAQSLNGQNQYLRIPQSASGPLNFGEDGCYTISAWVRSDVLDDKFHSIVSKGDNQYQLQLNSGKSWEFVESNSGGWEVTNQPAGKAKWVHVVGVRNGASQSLYVNGALVDNTISWYSGSSRNTSLEVNFGRNTQNTSVFFAGQIDEVGIAGVSRSADWIRLSYENQKPHQSLVAVDPENYGEWQYSRSIYLNTSSSGANVAGIVENFPVLIRLRADNFDFSQAGDQGQDIRFASASGLPLEYEIERWNATAKTAEVWVLVPQILGNNTAQTMRMYWGNPAALDRRCAQNVFSNADNYTSVWHLGNDPSGEGQKRVLDATYYGNHALSFGNMTTSNLVEGKLGLALKLNGSCNHLHHAMPLNKLEGTVSAWMQPDQIRNMVGYYESDGSDSRYDGFSTNASDLETDLGIYNGEWNFTYQNGPFIRKSGGTPQAGRWDNVVFKWDRTANAYLYINGQQKALMDMKSTAFASKIPTVFSVGEVGNSALDRYWKGGLDELRTMSLDISEDRLRLNYENQKDGQTLVQWTAPTTYVRIKNRWQGTYLHIENRTGKVQAGTINSDWQSAQWAVETSAEGFVRFRNRWTGEYIHIENLTGCVQYGSIYSTWASAKWYIDEFNGYKRIRNLWNGQFIHIENNNGFAQYGTVNDSWASPQWTLESVP